MKRIFAGTITVMVTLFTAGALFAASSDTITLNYEVQAINEINIDDASVTLTVNTAVAGSQPTQVSQATTYDITTNCSTNGKKLTAAINTAMPAGLTLSLNVAAPTGGSSAGTTTITNVAADVVTGIDAVAESDIAMTFYLDATAGAGVIGAASKTLTLTLVDAS